MKISAIITLKKDVLDPQGKVIHQALDGMGYKNVEEVRQGKYFEIDVKENDPNKAKEIVEEMCTCSQFVRIRENYLLIFRKTMKHIEQYGQEQGMMLENMERS